MTSTNAPVVPEQQGLPSQAEFIALIAVLVATVALSIDGMLPALPKIAGELSPEAPNNAQLVITSFVFGLGLGTLFTGPLSDAFGRRRVVLIGSALFIVAALVASASSDMESLLGARFFQGLGAAAPRVVALAVVRDLYEGRTMARIMSFVMMVFTLIPAMAPSLGALLTWMAGWRSIFVAFAVFSAFSVLWLMLRLPETLPTPARRPFEPKALWGAVVEMLVHKRVRLSILVQGLTFAILFATISTVQPIYEVTFDMAHSFHLWFGAISLLAISASFINARLVMTLGMRRMVTVMLQAQVALSTTMLLLLMSGLSGMLLFAAFFVWQFSLFFQAGLTIGNLNALAMEPMGHIAGMAASVIGSIATVIAVILAAPIGLAFDGTPVPLTIGVLCCSGVALILMKQMRQDED